MDLEQEDNSLKEISLQKMYCGPNQGYRAAARTPEQVSTPYVPQEIQLHNVNSPSGLKSSEGTPPLPSADTLMGLLFFLIVRTSKYYNLVLFPNQLFYPTNTETVMH